MILETEERDRLDSSRSDSPLMPADDAWILDTASLTVDEVVEHILVRAHRPDRAPLP